MTSLSELKKVGLVMEGERPFNHLDDAFALAIRANLLDAQLKDGPVIRVRYKGEGEVHEYPIGEACSKIVYYVLGRLKQETENPPELAPALETQEVKPIEEAPVTKKGDVPSSEFIKPKVTDSALALAEKFNVPLHEVEGSGIEGRILLVDVERYLKSLKGNADLDEGLQK
jgi:pyruvate/2-oxoglutarate dehydrogenase complex dihydrolipoamide acyltransferase (E2) component